MARLNTIPIVLFHSKVSNYFTQVDTLYHNYFTDGETESHWQNWETKLGYLAAQAGNLAMTLYIRQALHCICGMTLNYIYSIVYWCHNFLHHSVLEVLPSARVPDLKKTLHGIAKVPEWHRVLAPRFVCKTRVQTRDEGDCSLPCFTLHIVLWFWPCY